MSETKKKTLKHVKVIEGYKSIWRSALHEKPKRNDDAALRSARNHENFSGIEDLIEKFLKKNPFEHRLVLSLGCGVARDLGAIKEIYPSSILYGIDTSHEALVRAKRRLTDGNLDLICASMSHLPFREDLRFDMLIAGQSLELDFEENYVRKLLTETTRYSSPNCRFYMSFFGTNEGDLVLYKCTPIGNSLERLGWKISYGKEYSNRRLPFAQGVFWVAERAYSLNRKAERS